MEIDAHQHFWKFDPVRDSWINEEMQAIQRDFLPHDLKPILKEHGIAGCVVVQSDQSEEENAFQLANADANDFVKGVVGWVDLQDKNVEDRLQYYLQFPKMKGFRHVLQGETQRDLMLRAEFKRGVGLLNKYGFTYDILIFPDQLGYTKEFVKAFPEQKFVIDHIAKPYIKDKKIDEWAKDIAAVAEHQHVWCKISGMVTEADWKNWKEEDFHPYLDHILSVFGPRRLMYGSDWPVCNVAGGYARMRSIVKNYISKLSESEHSLILGQNAIEFYHL